MRFPRWTVLLMYRVLTMVNASATLLPDEGLRLGFAIQPGALQSLDPTLINMQPRESQGLELSFFAQVASHELRVPIMPLHLLGKKSWNVYNQDNIQKVKRDEASAKAIEDAEEQHMQEIDAERRIQLLRGEIPTPLLEAEGKDNGSRQRNSSRPGRERKRRKKAGENDTDFEMRIANELASSNAERQIVLRKPIAAPLTDDSGHIDLFPQDHSNRMAEKNPEAEKETAKKRKEYEDQYTMRFSNAAGFKQGLENPWYSKTDDAKRVETEKDVWGNEDPRRRERQAARVVSNDPLAMMRQGAARVRQVEKEKQRWREEKKKELRELEQTERRGKTRKRRHDDDDTAELEEFRLEHSGSSSRREDMDNDGKERRHRHKHRSSHRDDAGRHSGHKHLRL